MRAALQHAIESTLRVDWSQFDGLAALRCTVGVAVPLVAGLAVHQPSIGVFGAVGALSVGFGSFQGAYRSRATIMLAAALGMALSIFIGSLAGHWTATAVLAAAAWGFGSGLLVALGPAASFVGLQSAVAALVAGGFPTDLHGAAWRMLAVLVGGGIQTLLVVLLWPLRRFPAERRALATVYRSLAAYADTIPQPAPTGPEPHTIAGAHPTLADPQPFARLGEVLVFRALLDEAERIRASLAALALHQARRAPGLGSDPNGTTFAPLGSDPSDATLASLMKSVAQQLREIASALEEARDPTSPPELWRTLEEFPSRLPAVRRIVDSLLGQLRAAWGTAGVLTSSKDQVETVDTRVPRLQRLPPIREAIHTLRANLTLASTAFRHAVRLAVTLAVATAVYRLAALPRGYWVPLTALLVMKPEFHETFATVVARVAGTLLGAAGASLITVVFSPGPVTLTLLVLAFVWCGYALFRTNYALFTVCMTGYVVFLLALAGVPEVTSAVYRSVDTALGGALALTVYAIWPTWEGPRVRDRLAALLEAHARYVERLLAAYVDPGHQDLPRLQAARAGSRLARSNAEASVERMLAEPSSRSSIDPGVAVGVLAALRRHALAALALQARLDRGSRPSVPGLERLASEIPASLRLLAAALRASSAPAKLPPLRETQNALRAASQSTLTDETDLMVDSLNTMAELLQNEGREAGAALR